ncbi:MAG: hypothetical protein HWE11_01340 [Gammaproteobacteria bacterium]|nr:hypothetical protein [Gammaproteobacteria bacterium]
MSDVAGADEHVILKPYGRTHNRVYRATNTKLYQSRYQQHFAIRSNSGQSLLVKLIHAKLTERAWHWLIQAQNTLWAITIQDAQQLLKQIVQ